MNEIMTMRTDLANQFAAAGAKLLDFTMTAGALAAIPNTAPQQYAVAGTLETISAVLPAASPSHPQRRLRRGDRPTEPLSFDDEAAQPVEAAGAVQAEAADLSTQALLFALELSEHENDDAAVSFLKAWNNEDESYLRSNWPDFKPTPSGEWSEYQMRTIKAYLATHPAEPVGGALVAMGEPIYQRQEAEGAWRDTTLLGYQAWAESGRPTRIVYATPTESAAAPADLSKLRESLKEVADVLEAFGDLPDELMSDEKWHEHQAWQKLSRARELLEPLATPTGETQQPTPTGEK